MTDGVRTMRAERKALLATRAELDRTRAALALHEIRRIVLPPPDADRAAGLRPAAAVLVRVLGPLAGRQRLARWLRIAWLGLAALRIARNWR